MRYTGSEYDYFDDDSDYEDVEESISIDNRIMDALCNMIRDPDGGVAVAAINGLKQLRDTRSTPPMIEYVLDAPPSIQTAIISVLGERKTPEAIPVLLKLIKDEGGTTQLDVVNAILNTLDTSSETAIPLLQAQSPEIDIEKFASNLLADSDLEVSLAAVEWVAKLSLTSTAPVLMQLLESGKTEATKTTGAFGAYTPSSYRSPFGRSPLPYYPSSVSKEDVAVAAAKALAQMGYTAAMPIITNWLEEEKDIKTRKALIEALSMMNDASTTSILARTFKSNPVDVREAIVKSLGTAHDKASFLFLFECLQDVEAEVRNATQQSLTSVGSLLSIDDLIALLEMPNPALHRKIIEIINNRADPALIPGLEKLYENADETIRVMIADVFRNFEPNEQIIACLSNWIETDSYSIQNAAFESLGYLEDRLSVDAESNQQFNAMWKAILKAFVRGLNSNAEELRIISASAIMQMGDASILQDLQTIFDLTPHNGKREAAVAAASMGGTANIPLLIEVVQNVSDELFALKAIEILGNLREARAVPSIIDYLRNRLSEKKAPSFPNPLPPAIEALGHIGDKSATPYLLELLQKSPSSFDKEIVAALTAIGDSDILPSLRDLFTTGDKNVQLRILQILNGIHTDDAVQLLFDLLQTPNHFTPQEVTGFMGEVGTTLAIPHLIKALHDESEVPLDYEFAAKMRETETQVRALRELYHLEKISREDLQNELRKLMLLDNQQVWWMMGVETETWYSFVNNEWVATEPLSTPLSIYAIDALCKVATPETKETIATEIAKLLDKEKVDVRATAMAALGQLDYAPAAPRLMDWLNNENIELVQAAAQSLGNLQYAPAVPRLLEMLKSQDEIVQNAAIQALPQIPDESIVAALLKMLLDPEKHIRLGAYRTLAQFVKVEDPKSVALALSQTVAREEDEMVRNEMWQLFEKVPFIGNNFNKFIDVFNLVRDWPKELLFEMALKSNDLFEDGKLKPEVMEGFNLYDDWENTEEVGMAVLALGWVGDPQIVPWLIARLAHEDADIQRVAAWSLERIGTAEALEAVKQWRGSQKSD